MGQEYYWQAQFTHNGKQYNTPICVENLVFDIRGDKHSTCTQHPCGDCNPLGMWYWMSGITDDGGLVLYCNEPKNKGGLQNCISFHHIFAMTMFERMICRCSCMLHVIDGEKKREKEEERRKKEEKIMYFLLILRPIFVGGACGGLYGRGALAPPHNPFRPHEIST